MKRYMYVEKLRQRREVESEHGERGMGNGLEEANAFLAVVFSVDTDKIQ